MNAHTPPPMSGQPVPPRPFNRSRPKRSDQEFLAPELEILETPPSPVRMALILIICAFVAIALTWAYLGRVDIIATAAGKIEPIGKVKVVQPLETGKVAKILAQNGDHVRAGDVLVELEAVDATSQLADLTQQLGALVAEIARRKAAITLVAMLDDGTAEFVVPSIAWSAETPIPLRVREQELLQKDLMQLQAELESAESQIEQRTIHQRSVASTVSAQQSLNETLRALASMRESLVDKQAGSKAEWLNSLQALKTQEVTLTTELGQQADDLAAVDVLLEEETKIRGSFMADYTQKRSDAEQKVDELSAKVQQAKSRLDQLTLRSPIDGVVQASSLTTVGQVVTTSEELMRVVPAGGPIDVEAYLPNQDIGFVHVGQEAAIKVAAFPFMQYGTVSGKIVGIGKDAVSSAVAQQAMADPSHAANASGSGTADATQGLVFPIIVELDSRAINVDGTAVDLSPGMSVSVEVNTGSRRILEYLFSPMVQVAFAAMHER